MAEMSWTEAQWQKVNEAVTGAFGKASVASALELPCYGPVPGGTETVRNERLTQDDTGVRLEVDHDSLNLRFVNLQVHVELSSEQVADETMINALLVFRRAANILAQEEDRIVFDGYQRGGGKDSKFVSNSPRPQKGLADPLERVRFPFIDGASIDGTGKLVPSESVVPAVVLAIQSLEDDSNSGPFACILGNKLYEAVYTPNRNSLVLPADRIMPILKGPLLRSGQMNEFTGIVLSRSAGAVDIVVGTPPTVQFLQRTKEGRFLFRVYERFVLRLRDESKPPVAGFVAPDVASARQGVDGGGIAFETATGALEKAGQKMSEAADRVVRAARKQNP